MIKDGAWSTFSHSSSFYSAGLDIPICFKTCPSWKTSPSFDIYQQGAQSSNEAGGALPRVSAAVFACQKEMCTLLLAGRSSYQPQWSPDNTGALSCLNFLSLCYCRDRNELPTQKAEAGGSISLRPACSTKQFQDSQGYIVKCCLNKQKRKKEKKIKKRMMFKYIIQKHFSPRCAGCSYVNLTQKMRYLKEGSLN